MLEEKLKVAMEALSKLVVSIKEANPDLKIIQKVVPLFDSNSFCSLKEITYVQFWRRQT